MSAGLKQTLEAVAAEIAEQVRLLDGLVRYRFGDDAELMRRGPSPGMSWDRSSPRLVISRRRRKGAAD